MNTKNTATNKTADAAKPEETKREAFVRIATNRVNKAIASIGVIEGLANKANYDFNEADASKICAALRAKVDKLEELFKYGKTLSKGGFGL